MLLLWRGFKKGCSATLLTLESDIERVMNIDLTTYKYQKNRTDQSGPTKRGHLKNSDH